MAEQAEPHDRQAQILGQRACHRCKRLIQIGASRNIRDIGGDGFSRRIGLGFDASADRIRTPLLDIGRPGGGDALGNVFGRGLGQGDEPLFRGGRGSPRRTCSRATAPACNDQSRDRDGHLRKGSCPRGTASP